MIEDLIGTVIVNQSAVIQTLIDLIKGQFFRNKSLNRVLVIFTQFLKRNVVTRDPPLLISKENYESFETFIVLQWSLD